MKQLSAGWSGGVSAAVVAPVSSPISGVGQDRGLTSVLRASEPPDQAAPQPTCRRTPPGALALRRSLAAPQGLQSTACMRPVRPRSRRCEKRRPSSHEVHRPASAIRPGGIPAAIRRRLAVAPRSRRA